MSLLRAADQDWLFMEMAQAAGRGKLQPDALDELSAAGGRRGEAARRLANAMRRGSALSDAAAEAGVFMPGATQAIEAGERSGRLAEVLRSLSDHARSQQAFRYSIVHAILYPLVIACAALLTMVFLDVWVMPKFAVFQQSLIDEMDIEVPFRVGWRNPVFLCFQAEAFLALLVPGALLVLLYLVPPRCVPGRRWFDNLRLRLPLTGRVVHRMHLARWCGTAGMLFEAGVPEAAAVQLAGDSSGSARVQQASRNVQAEIVRGVKLGDAMQAEWFFPEELNWMVTAADKAGGHRRVWPIAQGLYHRQAEDSAQVVSIFLRLFFAILAFQVVGMVVFMMVSPFLALMRLMNALGG